MPPTTDPYWSQFQKTRPFTGLNNYLTHDRLAQNSTLPHYCLIISPISFYPNLCNHKLLYKIRNLRTSECHNVRKIFNTKKNRSCLNLWITVVGHHLQI